MLKSSLTGVQALDHSVKGYQIGQFRLDLKTRTLTSKDGVKLELPERNILFLAELSRHFPEPVSKAYLHKVLWPDREVSDWALSRIVSDTRLSLQDDGKQQELIKTARGIGYSLRQCESLSAQQSETVSPRSQPQRGSFRKLLAGLALLLGVLLVSFKVYAYIEQRQLVDAVQRIARHQDYSYDAFQAQSRRRDELVKQVLTRLNVEKKRQFEKFFSYYYEQFNQEERFVFSQIRAITESSLYPNNLAVYRILEKHPEIFQQIPKTRVLFKHLKFWLNKYRSIFLKRPDMGLLYVGVEDGVPYPSEVDQQIKDWLKHNL